MVHTVYEVGGERLRSQHQTLSQRVLPTLLGGLGRHESSPHRGSAFLFVFPFGQSRQFVNEFGLISSEGFEGLKVAIVALSVCLRCSGTHAKSLSPVCQLVLSFTVGIKCSGRPLRGGTGSVLGILLISNVRKEHVRLVGYAGLEPTSTLSTYCRKSSMRKCLDCHSLLVPVQVCTLPSVNQLGPAGVHRSPQVAPIETAVSETD